MSLFDEAIARANDKMKIDALVTDARIKWEKSKRLERIATAVLAGMGEGVYCTENYSECAYKSVRAARALIAELDKEESK